MKIIVKSILIAINLLYCVPLFGMHAQAPALAAVAPLDLNQVWRLRDEHNRVWQNLKNVKSEKAFPFKCAGLLSLGSLIEICMAPMVNLKKDENSWIAPTIVGGLLWISSYIIFNMLLDHYVINRYPSIALLRKEKRDFEQSIIDRVRQTNFPDDYYENRYNLPWWSHKFSSRFVHEVVRRRWCPHAQPVRAALVQPAH